MSRNQVRKLWTKHGLDLGLLDKDEVNKMENEHAGTICSGEECKKLENREEFKDLEAGKKLITKAVDQLKSRDCPTAEIEPLLEEPTDMAQLQKLGVYAMKKLTKYPEVNKMGNEKLSVPVDAEAGLRRAFRLSDMGKTDDCTNVLMETCRSFEPEQIREGMSKIDSLTNAEKEAVESAIDISKNRVAFELNDAKKTEVLVEGQKIINEVVTTMSQYRSTDDEDLNFLKEPITDIPDFQQKLEVAKQCLHNKRKLKEYDADDIEGSMNSEARRAEEVKTESGGYNPGQISDTASFGLSNVDISLIRGECLKFIKKIEGIAKTAETSMAGSEMVKNVNKILKFVDGFGYDNVAERDANTQGYNEFINFCKKNIPKLPEQVNNVLRKYTEPVDEQGYAKVSLMENVNYMKQLLSSAGFEQDTIDNFGCDEPKPDYLGALSPEGTVADDFSYSDFLELSKLAEIDVKAVKEAELENED